MKSFKLLWLFVLLTLVFGSNLLPAAEIRLAIAARINFPKDLPFASEDLTNFYGTNINILESPELRKRAESQLGQKVPESLLVQVSQIPRTSIISVTATGVDDAIAAPFLSALVDQFLKYKQEKKKKCYSDAIARADAAISNAPKELVPQLTSYRNQLVVASLLDSTSDFEKSDF